jgi:hypothetical protein
MFLRFEWIVQGVGRETLANLFFPAEFMVDLLGIKP